MPEGGGQPAPLPQKTYLNVKLGASEVLQLAQGNAILPAYSVQFTDIHGPPLPPQGRLGSRKATGASFFVRPLPEAGERARTALTYPARLVIAGHGSRRPVCFVLDCPWTRS